MFCKHCGKAMPDGVKFCPACGKPSGNPGVTTGGQSVSMYGQGGANAYQAVTAGIGNRRSRLRRRTILVILLIGADACLRY